MRLAIFLSFVVSLQAKDLRVDNSVEERGEPRPCTAGYGIREAMDDLVDLDDDNECQFLKGEVPFIGSVCAQLLSQGPCQEGEWLVIDEEDMLACEKRECLDEEVSFHGDCVKLNDTTLCKETFELIINEHGEGKCECPVGHLYHSDSGRCYVPYTRGPCRNGHIIKMKIEENSGIGSCEFNPCPREKMTPLDHKCIPKDDTFFKKCYTIGTQKPCKEGSFLLIEPSLAKPFCLNQKPNSIVPRIAKRAAPCQLSYTTSCIRKCDGPSSYSFNGNCGDNYAYFYNYGNPICLRGRCKKTSL